jgi:hypothetical protein
MRTLIAKVPKHVHVTTQSTLLRDALFTHPTVAEGLTVLLADAPRARSVLPKN